MAIIIILSIVQLGLALKQPLKCRNKKEILCDILILINNVLFSSFLFQANFSDGALILAGFIFCGCTLLIVFVQLAFIIKDSVLSIIKKIKIIRSKFGAGKTIKTEKVKVKNKKKREQN
jgi:hypothetical protein